MGVFGGDGTVETIVRKSTQTTMLVQTGTSAFNLNCHLIYSRTRLSDREHYLLNRTCPW